MVAPAVNAPVEVFRVNAYIKALVPSTTYISFPSGLMAISLAVVPQPIVLEPDKAPVELSLEKILTVLELWLQV